MADQTVLSLIAAGIAGTVALSLALALLVGAIGTATSLFGWAAQHGFPGIAVYLIAWIFAAPVMIALCLAGSVFWCIALWRKGDHETGDAYTVRHGG